MRNQPHVVSRPRPPVVGDDKWRTTRPPSSACSHTVPLPPRARAPRPTHFVPPLRPTSRGRPQSGLAAKEPLVRQSKLSRRGPRSWFCRMYRARLGPCIGSGVCPPPFCYAAAFPSTHDTISSPLATKLRSSLGRKGCRALRHHVSKHGHCARSASQRPAFRNATSRPASLLPLAP